MLDILDLCDEQGFSYKNLASGTGVTVFPKDRTKPGVPLYHLGDERGQKTLMRRIGLRFPGDDERKIRQISKAEKITMAEERDTKAMHIRSDPRGTPNPTVAPESQRLCRILDAAAESMLTTAVNIQEASKILKASHMVDSRTLEKLRAMETLLDK